MGVKSMLRNCEKEFRLDLAKKLLNKYWVNLTVKQVNFLNSYISFCED